MPKFHNLLKKFQLLHLTSSNLPIGNFTYSQGLEYAIKKKWVKDKQTFFIWQKNQIDHNIMYTDLPILKRLYDACLSCNINKFSYWTFFLLASKDTYELKKEETQKGITLSKIINDICFVKKNQNKKWFNIIKQTYLGCLVFLGKTWKISLKELALSFLYSWIENSIMVALKIVPFGQKTAHLLLKNFYEYLSKIIFKSFRLKNKELGASIPLLSIASSCHEKQKSRLFRS